ncbi:MAG: hypothetical protein AVDCRST_MAG06-1525 [uncultured Nocardioides sp.]|uniref:Uncharacterized protein n=1 Tax=uncultured Nocardioides sp. TaxID=198441 RepID=A0A6J4NKB1_9ACTN|nr:MAG: hypothetical protein AVDCRST_MAG06-1525 [uncultured Nocardioides sp.]
MAARQRRLTPDIEPSEEPGAWHPEDMLMAPLYSATGEFLGTMGFDPPPGGRIPAPQRTAVRAREPPGRGAAGARPLQVRADRHHLSRAEDPAHLDHRARRAPRRRRAGGGVRGRHLPQRPAARPADHEPAQLLEPAGQAPARALLRRPRAAVPQQCRPARLPGDDGRDLLHPGAPRGTRPGVGRRRGAGPRPRQSGR